MRGTIGAGRAGAGRGARRGAALLAVLAAACNSGAPAPSGPPLATPPPRVLRSLTVSPGPAFLAAGDSRPFTAVGRFDDASATDLTRSVTWSSSNPRAASVDPAGVVTAAGEGTATVTATHAATGIVGTATITSRTVVSVPFAAGLPHASRVGASQNYVRVTGLTPGAFYRAALGGLDDDVDLEVFSDLSLDAEAALCASQEVGTEAEVCTAPASAAGELVMVIDGQWTEDGSAFTLDGAPAPPLASTATLAYPAQIPLLGTVGVQEAFYRVRGLSPGARYQVRISQLTDDADLEVFADLHAFASACSSSLSGTVDDACTAVANPDGELLVTVDGWSTSNGSAFKLEVLGASP